MYKLMSAIASAAMIVGLATSCYTAPAYAWDPVDSNVQVGSGCSGTVISEKLVLTAEHCVSTSYTTYKEKQYNDDGTWKEVKKYRKVPLIVTKNIQDDRGVVGSMAAIATIKKKDDNHDLALVELKINPGWSHANVSEDRIWVGDEITIVGNPSGLEGTVTKGIVSAVKRDLSEFGAPNTKFTQISGGIYAGNSGGGVFNTKGDLVGVAVRGHRVATHLGFAVDLDIIREFLKEDNKSDTTSTDDEEGE